MFHDEQKELSEELQKAIAKAKGTDPKVDSKIEWLKDKWKSNRYQKSGEESCLMHSILFMPAQAIHSAVIADNLSYFKSNYKYNPENIELFLQEACLCGSQNIAEHLLLEELKSNYKSRPDLLAYITASMNTEWAKNVAHILVQENLPMPNAVYRLAHGAAVIEVEAMFKAETHIPPVRFTNGTSSSTSTGTLSSTEQTNVENSSISTPKLTRPKTP